NARGPGDRRDGARLSDPRAGHGPALPAPRAVPIDTACGAVRDRQLLAGRRRRRRGAELRHHRQAAVRVAGRSGDGCAHRRNPRPGRRSIWRVSGTVGDSRAAAGAGPPHSASARSRSARGARSAASHEGVRRPLRRLASAGPCRARPGGHRGVFFCVTAIHSAFRGVYAKSAMGTAKAATNAKAATVNEAGSRVWLCVLCLLGVLGVRPSAQTPARDATLIVTVVDQTRAVIPNATITTTGLDDATKAATIAPLPTSDQGVATI